MNRYIVSLTKSAKKDLASLPDNVIQKIIPLLKGLEQEPRPVNCKKLKGYENLWRIRWGNYRIVYAIEDVILLVEVREIGHRKDIYR